MAIVEISKGINDPQKNMALEKKIKSLKKK